MAILISVLLAPLLAPFTAHAISQSDFRNMDVEQAQELFGPNVPRERYVLLPSDDPGSNVKPKQLGVVICFESATSCSSSSGNLRDGVTFRFTKMHFYDRGGGTDSWDFIFTPELNGKPINSRVAFIYRSNTGGAGGSPDSWGIVAGDPGDGLELTENRVAGLESFGDTPFAEKLLDGKSNRESVDWAESGGISFSESQSDFADRAATDPFEIALEKLTEIVVSFSDAIVGALLWAVDQGSFSPGIQESWKVVRDVVNVLFIIVLVAMAMLSIVRIEPQKYNVRSLLPILVFAVISVNFSLLFAEIMLNTATVLSEPFLKSAQQIIEFGGTEVESFVSDGSFGDTVVMLLAAFIMLIALLVLLFFFVIRIIVVWLLAAASPILFLFMVLPVTRGEASKLLTQWIRWVYMAPIAFMLLYIGNEAAFTETGQSTGDAILSAVFYAVLVIAAVMIPLALGGRVMAMLASRGAGVAKLGGKAGLATGMMAPAGGGKTLGQRKREAAAFLKQRKDSQEQDAALAAAETRLALGDAFNRLGPGGQAIGTSITGMSQGQQVAALEGIVAQAQKEMIPLGMDAKMRIANAHKYGTREINGEVFANNPEMPGGYIAMPMDRKEQELAGNRINAAAAFRELAQAEFADPHLMEGARNYAWTGYQQLHKTDPVVSSYQRSGNRINEKSLQIKSQLMSPDDIRGLDGNVIDNAMNPNAHRHREYLMVMRNIDGTRLGDAVDATARNKMHDSSKRQRIYKMAKDGMFSSGLTGDEYAKQVEKEQRIIKHYERGEQKHREGRN